MMTRILTVALMVSAVALSACSSMGSGKTYPAPYSSERTAGSGGAMHSSSGEATFERRMAK
jgi:hypothetical protein